MPLKRTPDHGTPNSVPATGEPVIQVRYGHSFPLGATETRHGFNFAVYSRHATSIALVLFASGRHEPVFEVTLDPADHRTGDIWHIELEGVDSSLRYGWRADRQPIPHDAVHRFDRRDVLIDPYARALTGASEWGVKYHRQGEPPENNFNHRRSLFVDAPFDWKLTRPPGIALPDKVIYEMHVRGFTQDPSSGVADRGTYQGLIEKIPYLKDLGVTTVELLPVYEFDENETHFRNPVTGEMLKNYWGYSPICFFAPKASYATLGRRGEQVAEFKMLVRALHRAGLEVFLDVVFNHTAEGNGKLDSPTFSFRGLDNKVYYMIDPQTGEYRNYSGCGNTLNCNHPVVRDLILEALRYWVGEMHIDGFRFDLAAVLGRGEDGEVLANPPLLERIAFDPVLMGTTLIAEAWDAAGLYQVGSFPSWGRWAEWNGMFRDDIRRFVRGDTGLTGKLATRLAGSSDLYQSSGRHPGHSINFVTCHDGFTLADLVAYNEKHNDMNGEENRDGTSDNLSWNCGAEGPTAAPAILALRRRQVRNFLTLLLLSQGTPMLLGGDEMGRTQLGNNNAYCQDNEISWFNWMLLDENRDLFRFTKTLLTFRQAHPVLRRRTFLTGQPEPGSTVPDVSWHGVELGQPDWTPEACTLAMHLAGSRAVILDCDIYLAANNGERDALFALPRPATGQRWALVIDTAEPSPLDIAEPGHERQLPVTDRVLVRGQSCVVLRSA